ncbi:iron-sulfur cluster assembly scaffold protein [Mesomycoplasma lagogenitalium]|uniref:Iron-sulfur cluster assembly scaffold protein n=1 Tax=Mesomycoplasma lagogenitalium TaxID=171286 RepID=A0ABY8LVF3_9BACT|nr:iron-sulfur cluster assembly scaffold protein [Mesomycoplasma lagogenitalium]WGI36273.1 iron-sulfur cluster assembly scaffold protein [Mesomycoplasma lagogenitalium]
MDNNTKRQLIMKHYLHPENKISKPLDDYQKFYIHSTKCVDEMDLFIKKENNIIVDAKFSGTGCAVFLASTDIFLSLIKNKNITLIEKIIENYHNLINQTKESIDLNLLENLVIFSDVKTHLNRLECASLVYQILKKAI